MKIHESPRPAVMPIDRDACGTQALRTLPRIEQLFVTCPDDIDEGSFNHVVTYERMKGGIVYIRDPYGHESSMTEEAFRKHVVTVHLPDTLR